MSNFNLESQDNANVQRLMKVISMNTQKLDQNTKQIEGMIQQFGTPRDSLTHREKTFELIKTTGQLGKDTFKQIKELSGYTQFINKDKQLKLQQDRLRDTFAKSLTYFQDNEKLAIQKPKFETTSYNNDVKLIDFDNQQSDRQMYDASYRNSQQQQQQQLQMEQLEREKLKEVEEQNHAMKELEKNIVDVNTIFKDLAILVHDQGEVIDSIEGNIEQTHINVKNATVELNKAVTYQSKARRKKFILVLIALFVLGILAMIIYFAARPSKK